MREIDFLSRSVKTLDKDGAGELNDWINGYEIHSQETLEEVDGFYEKVNYEIKKREKQIKPMKQAATEAHKQILAFEKKAIDPLKEVLKSVKGVIAAYRAKVEREAEEKRKEEERKARELEEERQKLLREKESAEKNIFATKEEKEIEIPEPVAAVKVKTKKLGTSARIIEKYEPIVIDKSKVPEEYKVVDMVKLRAYATKMKEAANLPGVAFEKKYK